MHPRIQAELGDLFIESWQQRQNQFILESHSEHLVLRLLRRIRETTDCELPDGHPGLTPDEISVIYVDNDKGATEVKELKVNERGDFTTEWPKGFFEERAKELF